jgi:hypothetical protein
VLIKFKLFLLHKLSLYLLFLINSSCLFSDWFIASKKLDLASFALAMAISSSKISLFLYWLLKEYDLLLLINFYLFKSFCLLCIFDYFLFLSALLVGVPSIEFTVELFLLILLISYSILLILLLIILILLISNFIDFSLFYLFLGELLMYLLLLSISLKVFLSSLI